MFTMDEAALAPETGANGDGEEEDEAVGSKLECWIFCKTWPATSSTMELATGLITSTGGAVLGAAAGATAGLELVGMGGGAEDDEGLDIYISEGVVGHW